ncbi:ATP-dependent endonuclease, partial [Vibrio alginolyticus]
MNILSRKQTKTEVYLPSNKLEPNHVQCIERYLDAVRSDILFAKSVILVEGDAELILIPALVKSTLGISLDEMGISLIKMDGTVFKHISDLFHKERIRSYCAILTDLDEAFATETNDTFATDDFVKSQMNADKSGKERKKALDMYIGDNPYVKAFYAQNTFETELVKFDQNSELFTEVMDSNYKKGKHLNNVKSEIEDKDLCVRYNRALKFAKKIGKGWLATQMVEH